ncbi:hypothetical protein ACOTDF_23615, partial [Achromobacter insuavis]|uniref:hypothetical protein n=1 Tax=Achromobacter insuavis TaxID=1287735 RepID=UPI003B9BFAF9
SRACPRRKTARSLSCCRIGGNLLHKQNRQGCVQQALTMEHPDYPEVLAAGCVCAGHMEGSLTAARNRESSMRSRTAKRARWLDRKWKVSAKGNPTIKADGFRVTVYQRGSGYGATIAAVDGSTLQHARRNYPSQDQAKLAAFDHITRLLAPPSQ